MLMGERRFFAGGLSMEAVGGVEGGHTGGRMDAVGGVEGGHTGDNRGCGVVVEEEDILLNLEPMNEFVSKNTAVEEEEDILLLRQ